MVSKVVEALVAACNQVDPCEPGKVLFAQLMGPTALPVMEEVTDVVAYVALHRDGTIDTRRNELVHRVRNAYAKHFGVVLEDAGVYTETSIKQYARDFGQDKDPIDGVVEDDLRPYDVKGFNTFSDNLLLDSIEATLLVGNVPDRGLAAGTDHHWTPTSATSKTAAGRAAQPAFKDGKPIYPGRPNAHGRNQVNIQIGTGLETLALSIREGRPTGPMLEEQMAVLERLSKTPRVWTNDKDYTNQFKMPPIRRVCDKRRIPIAAALSHSHFALGEVAGYWDRREAVPVLLSKQPLYVKIIEKNIGGYQFKVLIFYAESRKKDKARKALDSEGRATQDVNDQIYSFILATNLDVTETDPDVIWWLYCQYRSRWGTLETYFRAMVGGVTRSQAHTMFWRNWWYLAGCLALNALALWRVKRRRDIKRVTGWVKELAYANCSVVACDNIEDRFKTKALGKPPKRIGPAHEPPR